MKYYYIVSSTILILLFTVSVYLHWNILINRYFPNQEVQELLTASADYGYTQHELYGLIAEIPLEEVEISHLKYERERRIRCGYPYHQHGKAQLTSFKCNTMLFVKEFNELSEQYLDKGESDVKSVSLK